MVACHHGVQNATRCPMCDAEDDAVVSRSMLANLEEMARLCPHGRPWGLRCDDCFMEASKLVAKAGKIRWGTRMSESMKKEMSRKDCKCLAAIGDNADCTLHVTAPGAINHPTHYNHFGIECADVTDNFSFNEGNVIKYVWRARHKGTRVKDLLKAKVYLEREIEQAKKEEEGQ